jgi:ABC-type antimicrobial peptide transport system permease subunit
MTNFRVLLIIIFIIVFIFLFGYIDFEIITPLLPLPEDICFYHTNTPPTWIKLFYLDSMEHTEPPFSVLHILILFLISLILGVYVGIKVDKWLFKKIHKSQ